MDSNWQNNWLVSKPVKALELFTLSIILSHFNSLRDDYNASINGVKNLLVRHSKPNNLLYVGELLNGGEFKPKMVLSCHDFNGYVHKWSIFIVAGSSVVLSPWNIGLRCSFWYASRSHETGRRFIIYMLSNLRFAAYSLGSRNHSLQSSRDYWSIFTILITESLNILVNSVVKIAESHH